MKTLLCCLALTSFIRCSGPVGQQEPATAAKDTSGVTGSSKGAKSARDHAEGILAGKIKPTDNDATMAWLDSLQSLNQSTRDYAFRVYKSLSLQSDGALGEAICGYIKDYFAAYPKEALVNYSKLNKVEKRQTVENIAFEFSMNGKEYKSTIDAYFTGMENKCRECQDDLKDRLTGLRKSVEAEAKQMVTE